jgi:hypothetical protein
MNPRVLRDEGALARLQDRSWTPVRLVHVARKLGLRELAAAMQARTGSGSSSGGESGSGGSGVGGAAAEPGMDAATAFSRAKERVMLHVPDKHTMADAQARLRRELFQRNSALGGLEGAAAAAAEAATSSATLPVLPPAHAIALAQGLVACQAPSLSGQLDGAHRAVVQCAKGRLLEAWSLAH